jgi:hypothetical protein
VAFINLSLPKALLTLIISDTQSISDLNAS